MLESDSQSQSESRLLKKERERKKLGQVGGGEGQAPGLKLRSSENAALQETRRKRGGDGEGGVRILISGLLKRANLTPNELVFMAN